MLDIQKELEKFNRLLQDVDDEPVGSTDETSPVDTDEVSDELRLADLPDASIDEAEDHVDLSEETPEYLDTAEYQTASQDDASVAGDEVEDVIGVETSLSDSETEKVWEVTDASASGHDQDELWDKDQSESVAEVVGDGQPYDLAVESEYEAVSGYEAVSEYEAEEDEASWEVTEHVAPEEKSVVDERQEIEQALADEVEETTAPVDINERGTEQLLGNLSFRVPNLGNIKPEEQQPEGESVDSLLLGARSALTDSHHLRPRAPQGLTVTLPEPPEMEEEDDIESLSARILPLLTFKSGLFEERLGAVVGAVAGVVILLAGVLFVPRLFSGDETDAIAASTALEGQDHLHAAAEPLVDNRAASLSIATFPPGARVYLNADLIGVTPFKDVSLEPGDYQVSVEKSNFAAIDTFLSLDSSREFFFDLSAEEGLLAQQVSDAEDHQLMQVSAETAEPTPQPVRESRREQRNSQSADVDEEPRREPTRSSSRSRQVQAPANGALVVTSEPMGAVVLLDGEVVGETPATLSEVTSGQKRLTLQKDGFVAYETEINVMPSIQTPFHAALAPVQASLFVNATPSGDLYVDDVLVSRGVTPGHMELVPIGTRTIRIVNPAYGEYEQVVEVTPDNKAAVSVDMVSHGYRWSIENGDRLFSESRYQEAIENYQRALSIRPENANLDNKIALSAKAMAESSMPAQDSRNAPIDGIYSVTDTPPQLIGGLEALHANVVYPEEAYNEGIQGRVYVQFVVDENGRAQDITIAKGLQGGCNEEAIRAVKRSRFKPATVGGVPVKSRHTLFVNFTI